MSEQKVDKRKMILDTFEAKHGWMVDKNNYLVLQQGGIKSKIVTVEIDDWTLNYLFRELVFMKIKRAKVLQIAADEMLEGIK